MWNAWQELFRSILYIGTVRSHVRPFARYMAAGLDEILRNEKPTQVYPLERRLREGTKSLAKPRFQTCRTMERIVLTRRRAAVRAEGGPTRSNPRCWLAFHGRRTFRNMLESGFDAMGVDPARCRRPAASRSPDTSDFENARLIAFATPALTGRECCR